MRINMEKLSAPTMAHPARRSVAPSASGGEAAFAVSQTGDVVPARKVADPSLPSAPKPQPDQVTTTDFLAARSKAGTGRTLDKAFADADGDRDGRLSHDEFVSFDKKVKSDGPHLVEAATGRPVDGDYMFSIIDTLKAGSVTLAQVEEHGYSEPDRS